MWMAFFLKLAIPGNPLQMSIEPVGVLSAMADKPTLQFLYPPVMSGYSECYLDILLPTNLHDDPVLCEKRKGGFHAGTFVAIAIGMSGDNRMSVACCFRVNTREKGVASDLSLGSFRSGFDPVRKHKASEPYGVIAGHELPDDPIVNRLNLVRGQILNILDRHTSRGRLLLLPLPLVVGYAFLR